MQIKFLNNQNKAQHVRGVPPSEIMIPYPNIRSLLESQTNFFKDKIFIIYEDEKISYNDFFKKVNQFSNFLINNNFDQNNLYSIYSNKPFFFLIELFAIWNIGGKIWAMHGSPFSVKRNGWVVLSSLLLINVSLYAIRLWKRFLNKPLLSGRMTRSTIHMNVMILRF